MQAIKTYLYPNRVEVQILDPTIYHLRKRVVYSRPITVYQGVDNPIQVVVNNQDNKPISLVGYNVRVDVQDTVNQVSLSNTNVTITNTDRGYGIFTLTKEFLNGLDQRLYKLTLKTQKIEDSSEQPLYIDDNYGVPLDLEVLPAYYPDQSS